METTSMRAPWLGETRSTRVFHPSVDADWGAPDTVRHLPTSRDGVLPVDQRLLANPLLAVAATIVWWTALRTVVEWKYLSASALVGSTIVLLPFFFRYHCLDCGHGGFYGVWKRHACTRVIERRRARRGLQTSVLADLGVQMRLWALVLVSSAILAWIVTAE